MHKVSTIDGAKEQLVGIRLRMTMGRKAEVVRSGWVWKKARAESVLRTSPWRWRFLELARTPEGGFEVRYYASDPAQTQPRRTIHLTRTSAVSTLASEGALAAEGLKAGKHMGKPITKLRPSHSSDHSDCLVLMLSSEAELRAWVASLNGAIFETESLLDYSRTIFSASDSHSHSSNASAGMELASFVQPSNAAPAKPSTEWAHGQRAVWQSAAFVTFSLMLPSTPPPLHCSKMPSRLRPVSAPPLSLSPLPLRAFHVHGSASSACSTASKRL